MSGQASLFDYEPTAFDWQKHQPVYESQAEIERAVAAIEDRR